MKFRRIILAVAAIVSATLFTGISTAEAAQSPYQVYNSKGSAYTINVYSKSVCQGSRDLASKGETVLFKQSYKVNAYSRYKIGVKGKWREVLPNRCVSNITTTRDMYVWVYNRRG